MSDGQILLGGVFALFVLVAIVALICSREAQRRKPNIRVPRVTSWGRAHKYYSDTH